MQQDGSLQVPGGRCAGMRSGSLPPAAAAIAYGEDQGISEDSVIELLLSLAEKNMLQPEDQAQAGVRFSMLETIREYGREQLAAASGQHIKSGVLTVRKAGGKQEEFYKIALTNILVSSITNSGMNGGVPTVSWPGKTNVNYRVERTDGLAPASSWQGLYFGTALSARLESMRQYRKSSPGRCR